MPSFDVVSEVEKYRGKENFEYAQLNYFYEPDVVPNDPLYSIQWPLNNTGHILSRMHLFARARGKDGFQPHKIVVI